MSVAAKAPKTPSLGINDLHASLAAELAVNLLPVPVVLKRFGMTRQELGHLLKDKSFKRMISQFKQEWENTSNSKERIRLKASLAVEEGLVEIFRIFKDVENAPTARLEAYKQLTQLADALPKKDELAVGPTFKLTMNLGGDRLPVTIDAAPDIKTLEIDGE